MTKFQDGPAAGKTLCLGRAPVFLRVVVDASGEVDALDQLGDRPEPGEALYAYRKVSDDGTVHVDGRDPKTGRRFGAWYQSATYKLADAQPDDATMRNTAAWRGWCQEQAANLKEQPE